MPAEIDDVASDAKSDQWYGLARFLHDEEPPLQRRIFRARLQSW